MSQSRPEYYSIKRVSNSLLSALKREAEGLPPLKGAKETLRFGRGLHELLLEPGNFDFRDYRGKDRANMMRMIDAVTPMIAGYGLMGGEKEKEFYYNFKGFKCKMRVDQVIPGRVVVDYKSTAYQEDGAFMASALEYDYHRQAAWYLDAPPIVDLGINEFLIIGISKKPPFKAFDFYLDRNHPLVQEGREQYMELLELASSRYPELLDQKPQTA